jgi:hypothetical protein
MLPLSDKQMLMPIEPQIFTQEKKRKEKKNVGQSNLNLGLLLLPCSRIITQTIMNNPSDAPYNLKVPQSPA